MYSESIPIDKESHLYCYSIARTDIVMPIGKLSAQLGHGFDYTLYDALKNYPKRYYDYHNDAKGGSKVSMKVKNENKILLAYNKARELNLPCSIVVDRDHVFPPSFDGSPIITALGIGPCTKDEAKEITKKFNCL